MRFGDVSSMTGLGPASRFSARIAEAFAGVVSTVAHHRPAALVAGVVPAPFAREHRPRQPRGFHGRADHDAELVAVVVDPDGRRMGENAVGL